MDNPPIFFDAQDAIALSFFICCWVGYALYTEHKRNCQSNLLAATNRYRTEWMRQMLRRDTRTMDAIMVGNLLRSITFFANTTIFILLGLMSLLGYHDRTSSLIDNIPFAKATTPFMWEVKIFVLIIIFIYAFFKYTWSLRQYNYAGIYICAAPSSKEDLEQHEAVAAKGTSLVSNAAKHFNDGLRAYYFGLAALAWFVHPYLLMLATAWVVFVTHRREYRSSTLQNLAK